VLRNSNPLSSFCFAALKDKDTARCFAAGAETVFLQLLSVLWLKRSLWHVITKQ